MAKLITPSGDYTEIKPANGKRFTCAELYKLINCELVERVCPPGSKEIMIVDEEGLLKEDCVLNTVATLWMRNNFPGWQGFIVGNAVICNIKQF